MKGKRWWWGLTMDTQEIEAETRDEALRTVRDFLRRMAGMDEKQLKDEGLFTLEEVKETP